MIEQRTINNEVYTIDILQSLTDKDRIDLEEYIKLLQEHKEYSTIRSSKFIIVNTHKTKEEIEEINNQDMENLAARLNQIEEFAGRTI